MKASCLPRNEPSPQNLDYYKNLQAQIQNDPYKLSPAVIAGGNARSRAYQAVLSLARKRCFNGEENRGEWINFESDFPRLALGLGERVFSPDDDLKDLTSGERKFCLRLVNESKQFFLDHTHGKSTSFVDKTVEYVSNISCLSDALRAAESAAEMPIQFLKNEGIAMEKRRGIHRDGKDPMNLKEFTRIFPEQFLKGDILRDLLKEIPVPVDTEVNDYLSRVGVIECLKQSKRTNNSVAELKCQITNLASDVNSNTLLLQHRLLTEVAETSNTALNITLELEKAYEGLEHFSTNTEVVNLEIADKIVNDAQKAFQTIEQMDKEVKEVLPKLYEKWKEKEVQKKVLEYGGEIAGAVRDDFRQRRNEKDQHFQLQERIRNFSQAKNERQQKTPIPHIGYKDLELFALDQYQPSSLENNFFDVQKQTKKYREAVEKLHQKREEKKQQLSVIENLSSNIDSNDEKFIKIIRKVQRKKERLAKGLRVLTTCLRAMGAVMSACVPGANVVVATATTIMQLGQEVVGAKQDHPGRRIQRRLYENAQVQHQLGNAASEKQNEIFDIEDQLKQFQSMLLSHPEGFTSEEYGNELQAAINKNSQEITTVKALKDDYQKQLDVARRKVADAQNNCNNRQKHLKDRKRKKENDKEYNKLFNELKKAEVNKERLKGLVGGADEKLRSFEKNNEILGRCHAEHLFLKPMKDQIEKIVKKEEARLGFDCINEGQKAGELTPLGKAQQTMRINFATYNQKRMEARNLAMGCNQAVRGFAGELAFFIGSNKPLMLVDLGDQFHCMYDRYLLFRDSSVPQLEAFMKDKASFLDKCELLHGAEVLRGFIIPGLQMVTSGMAILRLLQSFMATPIQNLENQYIVDTMKDYFIQNQQIIYTSMNVLIHHLDKNTHQLNQELQEIRSNLIETSKILTNEIQGVKEELKEELRYARWKIFEKDICNQVLKLRKKNIQFTQNIKRYKADEQESKIIKHLNELLSEALQVSDPVLNGLQAAYDDDKKEINFEYEVISSHPEFFGGFFSSRVMHDESAVEAVPNILLYKELRNIHRGVCSFLENTPEFNTENVKQSLAPLSEELQKQCYNVEKLLTQSFLFINETQNKKENFKKLFVEKVSSLKTDSYTNRMKGIQTQLKGLSDNDFQQIYLQHVGKEKYYLAELINERSLHSIKDRLDLDELCYQYGDCFHHNVYRTAFIAAGAAGLVLLPISEASIIDLGIVSGMIGTLSGLSGLAAFTFASRVLWLANEIKDKIIVPKGITRSTFCDLCEAKIIDKMQTPLKNFVPSGFFANDVQMQHYAANENRQHEITYHYNLSNKEKQIKIDKYIYAVDNYNVFAKSENISKIEKLHGGGSRKTFPIGPAYDGKKVNEKSFLEFSVKYNFKNFTYNTSSSPDSLIQVEDIERIKLITPATKQMKDNEVRLLDCYVNWLHSLTKPELLSQDNPFAKIAQEGEAIAFVGESLLPLILPRRLLEEIERILFTDTLDLMVSGKGLLLPFLDFKLSPSEKEYALTIQYYLASSFAPLQDYCSFVLATFDRGSVEAFKKVNFKPGQAPETFTYEIGAANPQEFLVQAMYAGNFEIALPGEKTTRLNREELYIPDPQLFDGLFNIWKKVPTAAVTYNSKTYKPYDLSSVSGPLLHPQYGKSYLSIWRQLHSQKLLIDDLKEALSVYSESYHICKGIYRLNYSLDEETTTAKLEQLGLLDPNNYKELYFSLYMQEKLQIPYSNENVEGIEAGIPNIGNACWMNTVLQWLQHFPRFQAGVLNELKKDDKGKVAQQTELTLANYGKRTIKEQLDLLRKSLFAENIYRGDQDAHQDPVDFLCGYVSPGRKTEDGSSFTDDSNLSHLKFAANEKENNLANLAQNCFSENSQSATVELPEYVLLEVQKATDLSLHLPNDGIIQLGKDAFAIVGIIEHTKCLTGSVEIEHYVSYIKRNDSWTHFDDDKVNEDVAFTDFGRRGRLFLLEKVGTQG